MIAVIADDLSGAAEMGGLGWRHGLATAVLHRDEPPVDAQLIVYDADSRNRPPAEARRRVRRILERLQSRRPDWLFKKIDSVLRGNVLAEIETAMQVLRLRRSILVPANPAAGRVIRGGDYYIHNRLIHQTDFRHDPRHPRLTSRVTELIGRSRRLVPAVLNLEAPLPGEGLIAGEAATVDDVRAWAGRVEAGTLAVGGAEFFRSLLLKHGFEPRPDQVVAAPAPGGRTLFVCGSVSETAVNFLRQSRGRGWPVMLLPEELLAAGGRAGPLQKKWARQIAAALQVHPQVVMGIGQPTIVEPQLARRLGNMLVGTARLVLAGSRLDYVGVEGGATAALLTEKLGWRRLSIGREFATGVVGMVSPERPGLMLVVKPGSYAWPPVMLN